MRASFGEFFGRFLLGVLVSCGLKLLSSCILDVFSVLACFESGHGRLSRV